jgi:hypothetical protein
LLSVSPQGLGQSIEQAYNKACWLTDDLLAEGSFWAVFPNISLLTLKQKLLPRGPGCFEKVGSYLSTN